MRFYKEVGDKHIEEFKKQDLVWRIYEGDVCRNTKGDKMLSKYNPVSKDSNNKADYFLLIGINNRIILDIIRLWSFRKEDIIRGKELYRRKILTMVNKPKNLLEFKRYEVTEKLKSIMNTLKEDINLLT